MRLGGQCHRAGRGGVAARSGSAVVRNDREHQPSVCVRNERIRYCPLQERCMSYLVAQQIRRSSQAEWRSTVVARTLRGAARRGLPACQHVGERPNGWSLRGSAFHVVSRPSDSGATSGRGWPSLAGRGT